MRKDVYLGDPGAVLLYDHHMMQKMDENFCSEIDPYVEQGLLAGVMLVSGTPSTVRVIISEDLNAQEAAEWVGRIDWKLSLPTGRLVVDGGCDPYQDFEDDEGLGDIFHYIDVPVGEYRVQIYTYISSPNGGDCLAAAGLTGTYGEWFKRTRPDEEIPDFFDEYAVDDEYIQIFVDDDEHYLVDFVVRLSNPDDTPLILPELDEGYFPVEQNARVPEKCPLGLMADTSDWE